jgi:hypothetical protein
MEWRECSGCGFSKLLGPDERACRPCADRGYSVPEWAGRQVPRPAPARAYEPGPAEIREIAREAEKRRLAGGEVRDPDAALDWLAAHTTIQHSYDGG